ncbi:hypothetical protein GC56T2_1964 [Geobacillus sp. C56-T2]|nr:hypothetical protein GC56T2_1964 [Geobacillus sp. C56-T2]
MDVQRKNIQRKRKGLALLFVSALLLLSCDKVVEVASKVL